MICISVTPQSRKFAKVDLLNASRSCDLIELCLDHLVKEPDIGDLLEGVAKPVLISCRRPQDGGHWQGTEEERLTLLRQAIVAGPAYVELDFDIAKGIPRFGKTKRVINYTSLDQPLGNVEDVFDRAAAAHADVVKFTWPTPHLDAAWPLLAAVSKKRALPVVGMGIGAGSLMFTLLSHKLGAPWIYAALEKGMEAYAGQPTVFDLREIYAVDDFASGTHLVGVVGYGAAQDATVRIFNAGFKHSSLNVRCLPLPLGKIENVAKKLDALRIATLVVGPQLGGFVCSIAQTLEDAAEGSQFVDVVAKQPDGWKGYNFLWRNVMRVLEATLRTDDEDQHPLDRRNVLLLGANGVARAMAYGIQRRQGILSVSAPVDDEAHKLAEQFQCRHVPFMSLYDTLADVVVLADPNIRAGNHKSELNPSYFRENKVVLDLCGLPGLSPLGEEAKSRGAKLVDPLAIYVDHMRSQFKGMTGESFDAADIEKLVRGEELGS